MANFNRDNKTGVINIIQWLPMNKRLQISTRIKIDNTNGWDKVDISVILTPKTAMLTPL
jgi:hypothetical protein